MSMDWTSGRGEGLHGDLAIPGDKSVSHRALMLAAIAEGTSRIHGFLEGEDTRATAAILRQLGVRIDVAGASERVVHGVGLHGLQAPKAPLDCGNSGTGMRLLAGLLAGQPFDSTLTGDASLSRRPMRRITDPLHAMGVRVDTAARGCPPLAIHGNPQLVGIDYAPPMASAQVKSAVLLAGLYAQGTTTVRELRPTRDYTERMLETFGWSIRYAPGYASLAGGGRLHATDVDVPADFSSAAFFLVAACVCPGSALRLHKIGLNPRRTGLLQVLRLMGADIRVENERRMAGETIGDLVVRHAPLHGVQVPEEHVSDMIDEFPALFVAAAVASGTTVIRGAAELRVKESDRLASMATALHALGVVIEETPDGAHITGSPLHGGLVESHGDHRLAMSLAVAGLVASGPVHIRDCANVATSFPGFVELANGCGFRLAMSTATE